jgi:YegS/Rv2252/BmrU family lipid kinase
MARGGVSRADETGHAGAGTRVLLIVNPGARRAATKCEEAKRALLAEGADVRVFFTDAPGHATELARDLGASADIVFTLGGDGTAMEVITALADRGPPVAVLPGGTGNILARSLGTPLRVAQAARALLHGEEARLDLGRLADGRHFVIGVGVGLDEAMIAGASPLMKKRVGFWAYVWSAIKAGLRLDSFAVRLTVDGTLYERRASSVLIANLGSVLGGVIRLGDNILYDDGVLHACVYSPANMWDALRIFARMLRGTVQSDPRAFYVAGKHFRLETIPQRRAQADGELLDMTPLEITTRPRAARVLIARRERT